MPTTPEKPQFDQAVAYTEKHVRRQHDQLAGLAGLTVAEAIHRLAAAAELLAERPT